MAQEAGNRLISAIQKQNEKTIYFCTAENISPNVAVHEIRKSFKRIRALLHFFDELSEPSVLEFKQEIKASGRSLSAVRESFVNVQLFEREIAGNQLIAERKLKAADDKLLQKNNRLLKENFIDSGLCVTIQNAIEDFNDKLINNTRIPSKSHLFNQVVLSWQTSFNVYRLIPADQPAEEMHELRKKMKRLWYQFDFLRFMQPRFFRLKTDQLNHIAEHLGEDHDLHVFLDELSRSYQEFNHEELKILNNQVLHLRDLNLVKLNPRLSQFFSETPEAFETKMQKIFKLQ